MFLVTPNLEAMYGGAAGGGKSDALLMGALQYVDQPSYAAILFRRTYADLALPGALMDRAASWLRGSGAKWNGQEKTWQFPSGASLSFGYLDSANDRFRYQSSEFQYIGFDELTQFKESDYTYLFSRLRRRSDAVIPLRMRSASNPGGIGHDWVKARFLGHDGDAAFVPAKLKDNPFVDQAEYRQSLSRLDHITRSQLEDGDWDAVADGDIWRREFFRYYDETPEDFVLGANRIPKRRCDRFATCDLAISEKTTADYTVIGSWAMWRGNLVLLDITRGRFGAPETVDKIKGIFRRHRLDWIGVESVAYQKAMVQLLRREGLTVRGLRPAGDKVSRAQTAVVRAESGTVWFPRVAAWLPALERELLAFPSGAHDDQVDMVSYACLEAGRIYGLDEPLGRKEADG